MSNGRPTLVLNLAAGDGNVFNVLARTRSPLTGQMLEHFNTEIGQAMLINVGTNYTDVLAIVNKYVRLVDSSGLYGEYAIDQDEIISAIKHFNEQLATLPDTTVCAIEGLYPEFDVPEIGPPVYLSFVDDEIRWVISMLAQRKEAAYERLLTMLQELASALRSAGIESMA